MQKTIDIHGFLTSEAKKYIVKTLDECPSTINELIVIHGSTHGNKLAQLVRRQIRHPRIDRILMTMNPGETIYALKPVKTGNKKLNIYNHL